MYMEIINCIFKLLMNMRNLQIVLKKKNLLN